MKILQINNYHYLKGGAEKVYFETSRILEQYGGHEVIHFSVLDKEIVESKTKKYFIASRKYDTPINKIRNLLSFFYSFEAKYNLTRLIKNEKPDIAHLHIFYGRLSSSILGVLKKHKIPVVMTVHEYKMLCPQYLFLDNKKNICEKCANGNSLYCVLEKCNKGNFFNSLISALEVKFRDIFFSYEKNIDKFIFVSDFIYKKHLEYIPSLEKKSVVIENIIDFNKFKPKIKKGDYFLYFGRLSEEKGLLNLLTIAKINQNINYKIVGTGLLENKLKDIVANNSLRNVEFLGAKYDEELIDIIQNCSFVIAPSIVYESFGLSIVESFSCSKPVIASNLGSYSELINSSRGFLFKYNEISDLMKKINCANNLNSKMYMEMAENCNFFIKNRYSEIDYYNKLINAYNDVFKKE
ncbi:glycosyltransferase family 4 protein [archaeon]|jgi:glycosyltransferase involved in cell wall biosynthesis|nr:glycosyltransferase family 4 protein [archaeon]